MLQLTNVKFDYPKDDFSLELDSIKLEAGNAYALVGPSGSGKTTLLNIIAGIIVPETGVVVVDGEKLDNLSVSYRRRLRVQKIGLIFQSFELLDYLSVIDNVTLPIRLSGLHGGHREELLQRSLSFLTELGIEDKAGKYPQELSHGEKQRVSICRAMAGDPKIILADEPTSSLDEYRARSVIQILVRQCKKNRGVLLLATHDQKLLGFFDSVIVMNDLNNR